MDERQGEGRRLGDGLQAEVDRGVFSKGVKIAAGSGALVVFVLTMAFKMYAQAQDFPAVKERVALLEIAQAEQKASLAVQLMMTCVLYQDAHPTTVPSLCDQAIRRASR